MWRNDMNDVEDFLNDVHGAENCGPPGAKKYSQKYNGFLQIHRKLTPNRLRVLKLHSEILFSR